MLSMAINPGYVDTERQGCLTPSLLIMLPHSSEWRGCRRCSDAWTEVHGVCAALQGCHYAGGVGEAGVRVNREIGSRERGGRGVCLAHRNERVVPSMDESFP